MTTIDVNALINAGDGRIGAVRALADMFREGLADAIALPEVRSDADVATHELLGCEMYLNMFLLATFVTDLRNGDTPPEALGYFERLLRGQLVTLASAVTLRRGPVGEHSCGK